MIITPSSSFTRPSDTSVYASGDLVANSTTAANVVPMEFKLYKYTRAGNGSIRRARLFKDNESVTNASFQLHLFSSSPTVSNGDNGALAVSTAEYYLGSIAIDMTTGAFVTSTDAWQAAAASPEINIDVGGGPIYGLLQASAAYAPASAETFTITLEIEKRP